MKAVMAVGLLLLLTACGGSPSGPTPVSVAPPPAAASPTPSATPTPWPAPPAGLDPAYVRALARVTSSGEPQRWQGGPFRHCAGPGVDLEIVARASREMTWLTGIPSTDAGPCNVDWSIDAAARPTATVSGTATAIVGVHITFPNLASMRGTAGHEVGHALGLAHSPRSQDMMHATVPERDPFDFSRDELAVLAWIYRR